MPLAGSGALKVNSLTSIRSGQSFRAMDRNARPGQKRNVSGRRITIMLGLLLLPPPPIYLGQESVSELETAHHGLPQSESIGAGQADAKEQSGDFPLGQFFHGYPIPARPVWPSQGGFGASVGASAFGGFGGFGFGGFGVGGAFGSFSFMVSCVVGWWLR
jgi:hypothetical protein